MENEGVDLMLFGKERGGRRELIDIWDNSITENGFSSDVPMYDFWITRKLKL